MNSVRQAGWGLAIAAWLAAPAAAQEPRPMADVDRGLEAVEERIELAVRRLEQFIERDLGDIIDDVQRTIEAQVPGIQAEAQRAIVLAQRQAGEAARRAAQRAREAERQRLIQSRRGPEHTDRLSRTLRLGRNGTFDLQNVSGDIVVTGGGGNEVRIDVVKRVRHPNEAQGRALLDSIAVRIEERNGNVEVRTDYPRRLNWLGGVDYTVALPREANVILRSVSGDMRVSNVDGDLRAETVSGSIIATDVRRIRQAKTISGDLEITDSDSDDVAGSTVSGSVIARGVKARSLDLQSVSGDIRMTDVESDRTFVRSVSGSIDFSGRLARNGRYEFQSHSGDVRVSPPGSPGFSIEASTFSGNLRSDYPLTLQGTSPNNSFTSSGRNQRALRASFGDGGAVLALRSFSGDITIVKR